MAQSITVNAKYYPELHKIILKGSQDGNWIQRHQPYITIWDFCSSHLAESVAGDGAVAEYQEWYLNITRKYHSRLGALHGFIGDLLKDIAGRTRKALPDVSLKASEGWRHVHHHSHGGLFDSFPLEDRRQKENEGRQDPGRRPKRGGHHGVHGGVCTARRPVDGCVPEPVVPVQGDENYIAENLGNDDITLNVEEDRDAIHTEGDAILTEAHDDVNAIHNQVVRDDPVVPEDHDMGKPSDFIDRGNDVPHVVEGDGVQKKQKRPRKPLPYHIFYLLTPSDESHSTQSSQSSANPPTQIVTGATTVLFPDKEPFQDG
ncbi:hypothetical protein AgCh_039128 [Apium graveolens]